MARKLSIVPGSIGVLLTALLIQTNAWWIRVLDFPRLQIAIFCFLALLLTFCCLHRRKSSNRILIPLVALAFLYQPSRKTFNLHCVHPEPPRPGSSTYERDTELFVVGRRIKQEQEPVIRPNHPVRFRTGRLHRSS